MKGKLARYLAFAFARNSIADLALMSLSVALAVFITASTSGSFWSFLELKAETEQAPSYLELRVMPRAMNRDAQAALTSIEDMRRGAFRLPADTEGDVMTESPSILYSYSYETRTFRVGESLFNQVNFAAPGNMAGGIQGGGAPGGASGGTPGGAMQGGAAAGGTAGGTDMPGGGQLGGGFQPGGFPPGGDFMRDDFLAGEMPPELADFFAIAAEAEEQGESTADTEPDAPLLEMLSGATVSPSFFDAYKTRLASGSLFTDTDAAEGAAFLVLGADLAPRLFADGQALGKYIQLDGVNYQIIGILEKMNIISDRDWNNFAFAPARDFRQIAGGMAARWMPLNQIFAASSASTVASAIAELTAYYNRLAGEDAITIISRKAELDEKMKSQTYLYLAAFALSLLCVLVAILNLMNAAATRALKRRRSLGILRAIGASAMDLGAASFWETALAAFSGLLLGSIVTVIFAPSVQAILNNGSSSRPMPISIMAAAGLIVAIIPLLLGTLPSFYAMRSSPADLVRPE